MRVVIHAKIGSVAALLGLHQASAFTPSSGRSSVTALSRSHAIGSALLDAETGTVDEPAIATASNNEATADVERRRRKEALFGLLGGGRDSSSKSSPSFDPVLADPVTKEPLSVSVTGPILGGGVSSLRLKLTSEGGSKYGGRTNQYINLLEPIVDEESGSSTASAALVSTAMALIPPPLRSALSATGVFDGAAEYVPMRDLFTSPSVSFAYERGWRQGFAVAGFPGADEEFEMATEYFGPAVADRGQESVLVDMSCATGLFTRRFAKRSEYGRVLGCDYSDSMLNEARRRIRADLDLSSSSTTGTSRLDLIRLDVGQIPMQSSSIDALHAGAAMHCWPDIDGALSEIYRVLRADGGRYFATTFLGSYFRGLQGVEGEEVAQSMQAFQYFESVDVLKDALVRAGFEEDKVSIEVLGTACVVIRCEK